MRLPESVRDINCGNGRVNANANIDDSWPRVMRPATDVRSLTATVHHDKPSRNLMTPESQFRATARHEMSSRVLLSEAKSASALMGSAPQPFH